MAKKAKKKLQPKASGTSTQPAPPSYPKKIVSVQVNSAGCKIRFEEGGTQYLLPIDVVHYSSMLAAALSALANGKSVRVVALGNGTGNVNQVTVVT